MPKILTAAVVAGLTLVSVRPASANIIYNLSNVTLSTSASGGAPIGTLTGSFTTNDARSSIVSFNIQASGTGTFAGFTYVPANATVTASSLPSQYFQLDSTGSGNELRLYFSSPLTASGTTISTTFSYEHEPSGGNRYPTGSIVAAASPVSSVPEPASFAALAAGLVGLAAVRRRAA